MNNAPRSQYSAVISAIQGGLNRRASEANRLSRQVGRVHEINGRFQVAGAGEAVQQIKFPVKYVEHPIFRFGAEVDISSEIVDGQFPTWSVTVGGPWEVESPRPNQNLYVGASLYIVTTGQPDQRLWIHWSATGRAITTPYATTPTTDSAI